MPTETEAPTTRWPVLTAVASVAVTALVLIVLGVAVVAQLHGRFSLGVGAMLLIYGLGMAGVAWLGWKRHPLAFGAMFFLSLLNAMVIISTANGSKAWWLLGALVAPVITLGCLLMPSARAELGHGAAAHREVLDGD